MTGFDDIEPEWSRIKILTGSLAGKVFRLPHIGRSIVLGRETDCAIRFDSESEPMVGRRHAKLQIARDGIFLQDMNSRNGTFYRDRAVSGAILLQDGDRFRLGEDGPEIELRLPPPVAGTLVIERRARHADATATTQQLELSQVPQGGRPPTSQPLGSRVQPAAHQKQPVSLWDKAADPFDVPAPGPAPRLDSTEYIPRPDFAQRLRATDKISDKPRSIPMQSPRQLEDVRDHASDLHDQRSPAQRGSQGYPLPGQGSPSGPGAQGHPHPPSQQNCPQQGQPGYPQPPQHGYPPQQVRHGHPPQGPGAPYPLQQPQQGHPSPRSGHPYPPQQDQWGPLAAYPAGAADPYDSRPSAEQTRGGHGAPYGRADDRPRPGVVKPESILWDPSPKAPRRFDDPAPPPQVPQVQNEDIEQPAKWEHTIVVLKPNKAGAGPSTRLLDTAHQQPPSRPVPRPPSMETAPVGPELVKPPAPPPLEPTPVAAPLEATDSSKEQAHHRIPKALIKQGIHASGMIAVACLVGVILGLMSGA